MLLCENMVADPRYNAPGPNPITGGCSGIPEKQGITAGIPPSYSFPGRIKGYGIGFLEKLPVSYGAKSSRLKNDSGNRIWEINRPNPI
jgi:hypothetical protein